MNPQARAIARQGFKARKMSPKMMLIGTSATQKITKMKVGVKFACGESVPARPAQITRNSSPTPISAGDELGDRVDDRHADPPGQRPGSRRGPSSLGSRQSVASAMNDTTSTTEAAQANSHSGIGRSARPTSPCALAASGAISAPEAIRGECQRCTSPPNI